LAKTVQPSSLVARGIIAIAERRNIELPRAGQDARYRWARNILLEQIGNPSKTIWKSEHLPTGVGLRDLGSVRLRDLASPEHAYQLTHPQLWQDFPALRSLEATPNNLPQRVTSFIGRERELAEVRKLMLSPGS
jgi:hypothetical protein